MYETASSNATRTGVYSIPSSALLRAAEKKRFPLHAVRTRSTGAVGARPERWAQAVMACALASATAPGTSKRGRGVPESSARSP